LKKLLVILILISLAGQTAGCLDMRSYCITLVQDVEDKGDEKEEKQKEKDYTTYDSYCKTLLLTERSFMCFSCNPGLAPLLNQAYPPPDVI
jgi:hypothetical protein